jgi:hypothetical protein
MKKWNVVLSVPVELDLTVEAENEAVARVLAKEHLLDEGIERTLSQSDFCSFMDDAVTVESWEIEHGA